MDTFISRPMPMRMVSTLDPPEEKSGKVTPTTGRMPVTIPRLKKACQKMMLPTQTEMN